MVSTSVQRSNAHVLHAEVMSLLAKGAVKTVSPAQSVSGFYSNYFLIPKKDGGLRPILNLRHLNHSLMKWPFRKITSNGCNGFAGYERCLILHLDFCPPPQAVLEICLRGSGLSIHGPPPWAVPGSPHFYKVHVCSSFPSETDGNPHPELPRRLAHFGSEGELLSHRSVLLSHIECLGLRVNFATNALSPSQRILFLETAASFKLRVPCPLKALQRMLSLMASVSSVLQVGQLHMRPLQYWLKPRVPPHAWHHGRLHVKVIQACVAALAPWKNHQ